MGGFCWCCNGSSVCAVLVAFVEAAVSAVMGLLLVL